MTGDEVRQMLQLLGRYATEELDQFEHWRLETPHGPVYVDLSRRRAPESPEAAYALAWPDLDIREGRAEDPDRPSPDRGTSLTAWLGPTAVGRAEIRWEGCASPEVRARFPGCPELSGLAVFPADLRSKGIGRHLIRRAEALAVTRGHSRLGLAATDRAAGLYRRLGYWDSGYDCTDRHPARDDTGAAGEAVGRCHFMVKDLLVR